MKNKTAKLNIPLYGGQLHITFADSASFIEKKFTPKWSLPDGGAAYAFEDPDENVFHIAFLHPHITPGVIAHECLHISNFILRSRGHKLCRKNDEAQAYLVGWLVNQTFNELKKLNLK